ncbi:MAG: hypothetical protein ACI9LG_002218 [Moritella dasanensis]|jgi:hypothetical protein
MFRIQKILFISLLTNLLASCAYHEYNPSKPDDYAKYWCQEEHRNNSVLAVLNTDQGRENTTPDNCDIYYR